jgi:uncharacterized membrane protein (UPF0127 family)
MPLTVRNLTRDTLLANRAERAQSFAARFVGLMGRRELPYGHGLWIDPCNSIHTFFMRIPIDVLFLDREQKVVKAFEAMVPWRMTSIHFKARTVLELPAGTLSASQTGEGDQLDFQPS